MGERARVALLLAMAFCAIAAPARADFPYAAGDPGDYTTWHLPEPGQPTPDANDLRGKLEWMYASTPEPNNIEVNNDPRELNGVRGGWVADKSDAADFAWRTTTGRPDVTVAVLDSGFKWNDFGAVMDIREKNRINKGEAPAPLVDRSEAIEPGVDCGAYAAGGYDVNGDEVFNVLDYACDSRVDPDPANGDGAHYPPTWPDAGAQNDPVLDPQDVLIAFTDGDDDDDNGFDDDMVGWDFLDDDNDPYDDVQYGHGTGEARDSTAEANNAVTYPRPGDPSETDTAAGELGTCPNCMVIHMRVGDSFIADVNRFAQAVIYAVDNDALVVQEALGTLNMSKLGGDAVRYAYDHGVAVIASAADEAAQHHNWPSSYPHTILVNSVTQYDEFTPFTRSYLRFTGCTNFSSKVTVAIPSVSCSSDATGRGSGMAGLVYSAALNAIENGDIDAHPDCVRTNGDPCPVSVSEVRQLMASGVVGGAQMADDVDFADTELSCNPVPTPACTDPNLNSPTTMPVTSPLVTTKRYNARGGHDQFYGWGRVNMNRSVDTVDAGTLPPEVELTGPDWYEFIDPEAETFALRGEVFARGAAYTCRVLVAPGSMPNNSEDTDSPPGDFVEVPSSFCDGATAHTEHYDGLLAQVDVSALKDLFPPNAGDFDAREPGVGTQQTSNGRPNSEPYGFTVKVVAKLADDRTGEDRRNMYLHRDQQMADGFPRKLPGDIEASPLLVDLDGDNRNEMVVASSDGVVHAFRRDGGELDGWPVRTDPLPLHLGGRAFESGELDPGTTHAAVLASPAAADMDGDGAPEVVVADFEGGVQAYAASGERLWRKESNAAYSGMPLEPFVENRHGKTNRTQHGFFGSPVLADVDQDDGGRLEVVAAAMDRHVYVWNHDGSPVEGYPLLVVDPTKVESVDPVTHRVDFKSGVGAELMQGAIIATPAVGDLDGDGKPEIVVGTNEEYVANDDGGFNADPTTAASFSVLGQVPGLLEFANSRVYAIHADSGEIAAGWPVKVGVALAEILPVVGEGITGSPVLADVTCPEGDEAAEVGTIPDAGPAYVFTASGDSCYGKESGKDRTLVTDFAESPGQTDHPVLPAVGHPAFGDLGGNTAFLAPAAGVIRALDLAVHEYQTGGQDFMAVWDTTTAQFRPGYPARMNDLQFLTGPSVGDVDGLPGEEVVAGSASLDIQAFNAAGAPAGTEWPKLTGDWLVANPLLGSFGTLDTDDGAKKIVGAFTRSGQMLVYDTGAEACAPSSWPRFHHDNANSGDARRDAVSPGTPMDPAAGAGKITWKAPGDDLLCGSADHYEVVTSDGEITGANFGDGEEVAGAPEPGEPGSSQVLSVPSGAKRYVGIRAVDEQGNVGRPAVVDVGAAPAGDASPPPPPAPPGPGDAGSLLDERAGGACQGARKRVSSRGIGRLRVGMTRSSALRALGAPRSRKPGAYRWCVKGGGSMYAFFDTGRARLLATTARRHRTRGVGPRSSVRRLLSAYPRATRASDVYRSGRLAFPARGRRVRLVAVGDRRIVADVARLRRTLARSGL